MAHVFKRRVRTAGGWLESEVWYLRFRFQGRQVSRRTDPPTSSRKAAEEQLRRAVAGLEAPRPGRRARTLGDVLTAYERYLKAAAHSSWYAKRYWLTWWAVRYGGEPLSSFGEPQVLEAIAELRGDREGAGAVKPGTIRGAVAMLKSTIRRESKAHPLASWSIPRELSSPVRSATWTVEELEAIRLHLPDWAREVVSLLYLTGLRVGDCVGLRWEWIREPGLLVYRVGKSDRDVVIPLSAEAQAVLERIPRRGPWLFPNVAGTGPRSVDLFKFWWYRAYRASGVAPGRTVHDIRRTFASLVFNRAQASPATIARLLGQQGTRMVPSYAHAELEVLRAAAGKVGTKS